VKRRRQSLTDKRSYEAWDLAIAERDRALSEAASLNPYDGVMVGTKKLPGMFEVVITIYCKRRRKPVTIVAMSDGR
jgi:hypothetical protein